MLKKNIILVVDDVEINRAVLCAQFEGQYEIAEADNGVDALEYIHAHSDKLAAILLDVVMPVMNGFEVLEALHKQGLTERIPVFLITAYDSAKSMETGYELGAMDIIIKPITPHFVQKRVNSIIELFRTREKLLDKVIAQEKTLKEQSQEIQELNYSIIETLSTAIEFRDCESGEHVQSIRSITHKMMLALRTFYPEEYMFSDEQIEHVSVASVMHDVGKIAIPDSILNKPGRLTDEEFAIMKTHTIKGCELLDKIPKSSKNPIYDFAYDICRHHHERWDGHGYPDGLRGDEISIYAQIVSLADVYDALTSERVYKPAYSHEQAVKMILNGECGAFNPVLLDCFEKINRLLKKQ